ncbi:hypothetical protein [Gayadomonas joobiniege]|uniref:hypothetical protein n=1 Tax=Gayadomonas joobiniege TaxID=1234606 RepID=UPI00035DF1A8|nr:hypothetical protein [Gayadomonas joobiniege]
MLKIPTLKLTQLAASCAVSLSLLQMVGCTSAQLPTSSNENSRAEQKVSKPAELSFALTEGKALNQFYRNDEIATHSILTGGHNPRLIVAFAADNSGTGLWFEPTSQDVSWTEDPNRSGVIEQDENGHTLRGVRWQTQSNASELTVKMPVLSNIRILRDYLWTEKVPETIVNQQTIEKDTVTWYRERLDNQSAYQLKIKVINGSIAERQGKVVFTADAGKKLAFEITSALANSPLTPIEVDDVLKTERASDYRTQQLLAFLSYEEKLFAGSWRFLTYFGRDTLLSVRLLMPVLSDKTMLAGLGSVLSRVNDAGEVAHEEDLGEFAVIHNHHDGKGKTDQPRFDYKMVDDNYLLAPIFADYIASQSLSDAELSAFLQQTAFNGKTYAEQLKQNLAFVYQSALAYAKDPKFDNLIALKPGSLTGEWRDSHEGLGYGRYPYNINAVFVPAALNAIKTLLQDPIVGPLIGSESFANIEQVYQTWYQQAPLHFKQEVKASTAAESLKVYAKEAAIEPELAQANASDESFYALALMEDGSPVPVIHSDVGFALLFQQPSAQELKLLLKTALKPYPYGLITDAGVLVANPVYANQKTREIFTNHYYHGAVVWSWQQALMLSGVNKQLQRSDLPANIMQQLKTAQTRLYQVVKNTDDIKNSELWTWEYKQGQFEIVPFGQTSGHKSESNAAQLWSTVYLAIPGL